MEQLQYEVNFLTIKYQEQTIKLHQIGIEDIFTNFYANSFSSIFKENRDGILDEKKGYILSNIEITNNYMLGEYGVFPDISNEQVRNISYSDYTDEDKIQASTHITYFLINFNNLNVYLIKNSNTPSFASAMNQVLRRYGFRIDFEVDKDWKKNIIESLYEISSIEVSVYNDTLTENNMVSLHKLNDIKDTLIYEGCKFKIKNITPQCFIEKLEKLDFIKNDFAYFRVNGKSADGQQSKYVNILKDKFKITKKIITQKEINATTNKNDLKYFFNLVVPDLFYQK